MSPMVLNESDFWECSVCRLQAHSAASGMFCILRTRGFGDLRSCMATEHVRGWVLARQGNGVAKPQPAGIASIKDDLNPETFELFGQMIDAFAARKQRDRELRRRDMPDWLAVGSGFETEDELRSFLKNEVETIRTTNENQGPIQPT